MAKHQGVITYFSEKRGYGFISSAENQSIFVHFSAIEGKGYKTLKEGQKVVFDVEHGKQGLEARNVQKL